MSNRRNHDFTALYTDDALNTSSAERHCKGQAIPISLAIFIFAFALLFWRCSILAITGIDLWLTFKKIRPSTDKNFSQLLESEKRIFSLGVPAIVAILTGLLVSLSGAALYEGVRDGDLWTTVIGLALTVAALLAAAAIFGIISRRQTHFDELTQFPERILLAAREISVFQSDAQAAIERLEYRVENWESNSAALTMGWKTTKHYPKWQAALEKLRKSLSIESFEEESYRPSQVRSLIKKHHLRKHLSAERPIRSNLSYVATGVLLIVMLCAAVDVWSWSVSLVVIGVIAAVAIPVTIFERHYDLMVAVRHYIMDSYLATAASEELANLKEEVIARNAETKNKDTERIEDVFNRFEAQLDSLPSTSSRRSNRLSSLQQNIGSGLLGSLVTLAALALLRRPKSEK